MQLSPFTDIGLRTIMRLAVDDEANSRVTTKLIARQVGASERHVAKAVSQLVGLGLVEAQRGRSGGLFITAAGRAISVGSLIRELEGDREVVACGEPHPCPLVGACRLRRILADAKDAFYRELGRYSIEELVASPTAELLHLLAISPASVSSETEEVSMNTDSVVRAEPELEPHHAEVIRATLPLVGANIDRITTVFYRTMFAAHPELLRDTFNRGNQAQGSQPRALAASIATFATYLVDPSLPQPTTMLSRIAHKHASLGVTADQYQIVHDNLFAAIVEVLGADVVDATVAAAWERVYWLMADTLIDQEKGLYAEAGVDSGDVFRDARVLARVDDPSGVAVFTVESSDPAVELPGFVPGQYISVGVRLPDGARQLRQYSLVGLPGDGTLSFAVKRVEATDGCPAGEVSSWLHENLRPGDELQVTVPFGDVAIDTTATTPLVLISAGIGDTPMIGALEYLAAHAPWRRTLIVHADRGPDTHPLRARLHELAARLDQADVEIWYEEPTPGARHGLMDLSELTLPADADVYVCGPGGFLCAIARQLRAAGVPEARVHIEQFTPGDEVAPERVAR